MLYFLKIYNFSFISFVLGDISKIYYYNVCQRVFYDIYFPLEVLRFYIQCLIHFAFTFVDNVRKCSNLTVLHVAVQFSQALFLKTLSFLHCVFLPPCHRLIDHGYVSFPGVGNSNPLQYSCLETSMARGAWWAIVHEIENTTEGLSTHMWVYF